MCVIYFCVLCTQHPLSKLNQPTIKDEKIRHKHGVSGSVRSVCRVCLLSEGFHHTAIQRANLSGRCLLNPTVQTRFSPYSSQIRTWAAPLLKLSGWSRKPVIVLLSYYTCTQTLGGKRWSEPLKPLCIQREACCHKAIVERDS